MTELPPVVTDAGLKLTDTPAGCPLALRFTVCVEPVTTAVLIVAVALPPCAIVRLLGLAPIGDVRPGGRPGLGGGFEGRGGPGFGPGGDSNSNGNDGSNGPTTPSTTPGTTATTGT